MKSKAFPLAYLAMMAAASLHAQTSVVLHAFAPSQSNGSFTTNADGSTPVAALLLSSNTLYGTTSSAGSNGTGTLFSMGANGSGFKLLHTFAVITGSPSTNADGAGSAAPLVASSNMLFGTAQFGGTGGWGTVFSLGAGGNNFSVLHAFTNHPDGASPVAGLLLSGGTLYGTANAGGQGLGVGLGTVFSLATNGSNYAVLHRFAGNPEGANPAAGLAISGSTLFGTTRSGGPSDFGTVFSLDTSGSNFTTLHSFTNSPGGQNPQGGVVVLGNKLYGTTSQGGTNSNGIVFSMDTSGSNFTVLHFFTNSPDGANPYGDLLLSGGTLYGITRTGGTNGGGAVYSLSTSGSNFTELHSFMFVVDGIFPYSGLILSGTAFYGATSQGCTNGTGAVYSLQLPGPSISAIAFNPGDTVSITFSGFPNASYLVQAATNLTPPVNWQNIATNVAGTNGLWQFIDTNVNSHPARFFRVSTP